LPIAALCLLALAHIFDFGTFLFMILRHGLSAEFNPVVVAVAQDYGLPGLTIAKVASVFFLTLSIVLLARHDRRRSATVLLLFGIVAGIFGGVSNMASS
jgi:hypothetical protein